MGLVEVANGFAQLIGRNNEVTEKTTVTLEDVSVKGWWQNKKGDKIHINPETMVMIQDGKELTIVDLETPRSILEEGGYVRTSVPPEERVAPVVVETQETTVASAQVVDLDAVRVAIGGDSVSSEQEHKNTLAIESERISAEIEERKASIFRKFVELAGSLGKKKKNASRENASRLLEEATTEYQKSLTIKGEQGSGEFTSEYIAKYRACLESLRNIDAQVDALVLDVQKLKQPGVLDSVETGTAAGAYDNLNELLKARANAPKAPEEVTPLVEDTSVPSVENTVKDKGAGIKAKKTAKLLKKEDEPGAGDTGSTDGGGPEGPEDGEGLTTLLKARQEKVVPLIDGITTPQGFADFRRTLRKVKVKDSQEVGAVRWYFIDQDTLVKELSEKEKLSEIRRLSEDEKKQVYVVEDFLRDKLRRTFFELKDVDVARFYDQEQAKIIATQSEAELETLMASWPKDLGDTASWKDLLDTLTVVEKKKIDDGYDEVVATLIQNAEIQRRELQLAPAYQALDTFLERGDKAKEKVRMFQEIIDREYGAWSSALYKEAKKMGGTVSRERRWALWQEQGGDAVMERVIVAHLKNFDGVDPEEGKKIFRALRETLMKQTNQEA